MLLVLELTSELPLWDAASFFRVARDTTPAVVQHHALYSPFYQLRMLSVLACRYNRNTKMLSNAKDVKARCWGHEFTHSSRHEVLMLRCLVALSTLLTAGQQDATVDVTSKPRGY